MRPDAQIDRIIVPLFTETTKKKKNLIIDIELEDAPIPITRRLSITSNMNLGYVQEILMLAMGWEGYHLKEIRKGNLVYTTRSEGGNNPKDVYPGFTNLDSYNYTLGDLLKKKGDSFEFIYDFGDNWTHRVTLVQANPAESEHFSFSPDVIILTGENCCPPEDVGGTSGYENLLSILSNPKDEEYEDMVSWLRREDFDPEYFDKYMTQRRIYDFLRTIDESRWGYYSKI